MSLLFARKDKVEQMPEAIDAQFRVIMTENEMEDRPLEGISLLIQNWINENEVDW